METLAWLNTQSSRPKPAPVGSDDFRPNLVGDKKDQTYLMSLPEVERENILMLRYQKRQKRLAGKADKSARDAAKKKTKKKT